jgi:hypothetical protein
MTAAVHLGDLLALRQRSSQDLARWLSGYDEALAARLREEAQSRDETLAQFVRIAVSDFLAEADEEAWADLVSAIRDAEDPGARCLAKMAAFRLRLEMAG